MNKDPIIELVEVLKRVNKGNKKLKFSIGGKKLKRKPDGYWLGVPIYIKKNLIK